MRRSIFLTTTTLLAAGMLSTAAAQQGAKAQTVSKPPAPLPMGPVAFPAFAERTLKSGAQMIVVENHEQPVVTVQVYIRGAGQVSDSDAKPGVAAMTATLLDAGTKGKTSKQIAETVEDMGANLSTNAGLEWATLSATMLKSDVDAMLDVMADVLVNPTYPADEVETERKRSLTDLQVALSRPATLAQRAFEMRVFGSHPYGRQLTTTALRSITREDLVAFHQQYYKPGNALIVVAGDVNADEIQPRIEQHFAAWTGTGPARPKFAAAPTPTARQIVLVNKPGAVQAAFRIGHTIVPATNPDWPALVVAQQVLGGGSNGWLFENLREKKGFTYGAYAQSSQRIDPGYFQMWGDVRNEVADSALELFLSLANRLKTEPVPTEDLELAKSWLTGNFPLTIETPTQIALQVAQSRLLGQPKDHVQTWRTRLGAVTAADVQRVARAHLLDNQIIVISGDAAVLKPKLEKFGTITVVDEDGRPVADAAPAKPAPVTGLDATSLPAHSVTYSISAQGNPIAETVREVSHEMTGGKDVIKVASTTTGMFTGKSELKFDAKTFTPVSSSSSQQMGGRESSAMLTVANGKVTGMMMSPMAPDPQMVDAAWTEGSIFADQAEYAIALNDWATNKELKLNLINPQSGTLIPITIKATGESKQKVAAGEFDVYDLELSGGPMGNMKLSARKAAPHVMVRQEMSAQPIVIELKAIK